MTPRPPKPIQWLLARALPNDERSEVLGDLAEQYADRCATTSSSRARLWYLRQAASIPLWFWGARLRQLDADVLELRPVARRLARSPGFTLVAVASLGLGVGANTAIFSALRALVYSPLAVERPEELRFLYHSRPEDLSTNNMNSSQDADPETGAILHSNVTFPVYRAMQGASGEDLSLTAYTFGRNLAVVDRDRPAISASGLLASGNYFDVLGLPVVLGRPLLEEDDRPGAPLVAVLSHTFWQSAFGGDPGVVGRVIALNGHPTEVVGVSRAGFEGLSPGGFFPATHITVPLSAQPLLEPRWTQDGSLFEARDLHWLRLLARVPEGATVQPALEAMTATLRQGFRDAGLTTAEQSAQIHARLLPGARGLDGVRGRTERPLKILAGVVALVLLIACANVATLLLARGASRERELAVRRAMGASRLRLVWPLLLESILLAAMGGLLGISLAWWGGAAVAAALTAGMGVSGMDLEIDGQLLGLTAAVAGAAALLSGVLPALKASTVEAGDRLGARGAGRRRSTLSHGLIVTQIAVSMPLVVGGGLLLRTVSNLQGVEPGLDVAGLTVFRVNTSTVTADAEEARSILAEIRANVAQLPGVRAATLIENVFLSGWYSNTRVEVDGEPRQMYMNAAGPEFFETLGIPILAGRALDERDDATAPPVVVVNATAARTLFGGSALGRTFRRNDREVRIVGVSDDVRYDGLRGDVPPTFFDPIAQRGSTSAHVALRSTTTGPALEQAIREAVARVHPGLPVTELRTQEAQLRRIMNRERVFAGVLTLFGGFALLLASIGLHGITAFSVARKRSEMGIRLALGAKPQGVLRLVLRQVAVLSVAGIVLGMVLAYLATPVVGSLLYDVAPSDPVTLAAAATALLAVALVAGWLPARRAARTDPLEVLSAE